MLVTLNGEMVRRLRESNWMTMRELAEAAGVSESTISNVESQTQKKRVRPKTARKIAVALGVEPRRLACPPGVSVGGATGGRAVLEVVGEGSHVA